MEENENVQSEEINFNLRDIASFLLSKLWIIALVGICCVVVSYLFVNLFVTPKYKSSTEVFVISNQYGSQTSASDWSIGKQLTTTSKSLVTQDFCQTVADLLNSANVRDPADEFYNLCQTSFGESQYKGMTFVEYYSTVFKPNSTTGISASYIKSIVSVSSNSETLIVTFTAQSTDPYISAVVANTIAYCFKNQLTTTINNENLIINVTQKAMPNLSPSNINEGKSMIIAGVAGIVAVCAILVVVFLFDDKIKNADDVEKQLKLSVLGTIPDIEEEA